MPYLISLNPLPFKRYSLRWIFEGLSFRLYLCLCFCHCHHKMIANVIFEILEPLLFENIVFIESLSLSFEKR